MMTQTIFDEKLAKIKKLRGIVKKHESVSKDELWRAICQEHGWTVK